MHATHTPEALADAVLAGVREKHPELAYRIPRGRLREVCTDLPDLGWHALMVRRWAEHEPWDAADAEDVLTRIGGLATPPERPRSVRPVPQDECPEHPGPYWLAGLCEVCEREAARVPPARVAAQIARVRAQVRPLRGSA